MRHRLSGGDADLSEPASSLTDVDGTEHLVTLALWVGGVVAATVLLLVIHPLAVVAVPVVLVGAVGGQALERCLRNRQQHAADVRERAEEQHRWVLRGDSRGVYGPDGAALMDSLTPEPPPELPAAADDDLGVATVAHTDHDLAVLLRDRPPGWHWAAFGSVLVLRRDAVAARLRDQQLGYAPPSGVQARTDQEAADLACEWAGELTGLIGQVQQVIDSRGLRQIFDHSPSADLDADTVLHPAHRLMDLHDRFLDLSEACRGLAAPPWCRDLLDDLGRLIDVPLDGYRRFIDDYLTRLGEIPAMVRYARGPVELDPVVLDLDGDDALIDRFFARLREIDRG